MPRSVKKPKARFDISALRKKSYEALFLSDIHFLISDRVLENAHTDLLGLLETLRSKGIVFRDIFLVGDVVENWYFSAEAAKQKNPERLNRLFELLSSLWSRAGSLYYIIGNHDTIAFNQGLSSWLQNYLEKREWIVCNWYQNAHFIAIHGHQGQYSKFSWGLNILGVRTMYALGRLIPGLFGLAEKLYNRNLNHSEKASEAQREKYYKKLSRIVHRRDRLMITGHTHEFLCLPDQKILNTGDWLASRTLVVQDKTLFCGYRLIGKRLAAEYRLDLDRG